VKNAKAMVQVMAGQLQQAYDYLVQAERRPGAEAGAQEHSTCRVVFG